MYKKKLAMDTSNNHEEEATMENDQDPLATGEQQNGNAKPKENKKKKGRKGFVLKIGGKGKNKKTAQSPGPAENGEYEVEAIVDHKKQKGRTMYRIRWKGWSSKDDTWLAANDLSCKDLLRKYRKKMERENKDVYTVQKIIDHRRLHGTVYYRVRWEGYSARDDTWQAKDSLNCNELLKEYNDKIEKEIMEREKAKLEALQNAKNSNNEYEVEAILGKKTTKSKKTGAVKTKYLIRWKGWGEEGDTWEPENTLNCNELIRAFNKKNVKVSKPIPKTKATKKRKRNYDSSGSEEDDSDDSDYGASKRAHLNGEYEVAKILNARINRQGKWEFFVMWKGFGPEDNTWEPESNLNCTKLINEYLGKFKVPRGVQAKLEQISGKVSGTPKKAPRKPPAERKAITPGTKRLQGRKKGEMKVV